MNINNLEISSVEAWEYRDDIREEFGWNSAIRISWRADIGFGQYDLIIHRDGRIEGCSECMDSNEDKSFIKMLLDKVVEKIEICD